MARRLSDYQVFVSAIQRALPAGATWTDRQQAMKRAGALWRAGHRNARTAIARLDASAKPGLQLVRANPGMWDTRYTTWTDAGPRTRRSRHKTRARAEFGRDFVNTMPWVRDGTTQPARVVRRRSGGHTRRRNPTPRNAALFAIGAGALAGRFGTGLIPADALAKFPPAAQQYVPYAVPALGGVLGSQLGGERLSGAMETLLYGAFGVVGDFVSRIVFKPKTIA